MKKEKKKFNQKETLIKVLRYIKPYKFVLALTVLMAVISVALTLYLPILTGDAVDRIAFIFDPSSLNVDMPMIWQGLLGILRKMGAVIVLTALTQWVMNICNNKMVYSIIQDIRKKAFKRLEELPLKYLDAHSHGDIVSRVVADVDQFADGLLIGFTQLFTGVVTILGTLGFMLSVNVGITVVVVVITPVSLFVASFIAKQTFSMFKLQSETRGEQTALINEMIGNQKVVQAFGREEKTLERFDEINGRLEKCSLKAIFFSSITNPATRFVNSLVYAGVGIFGAFVAIRGGISVGRLSCFLSYANQYTKPFNEISGVVTELQNALACAGRIFELIGEEPQVPDRENAIVLTHARGNVALENVNFSYVPEKKLIQNFNLDVKPGQRVAIVGPTGCGKTTVINLLMRFYDVDSGKIRVDGRDIRDITRGSLRTSYGMVLQETWLKAGTIRENLIMGKPEATEDTSPRRERTSHIAEDILRLKDTTKECRCTPEMFLSAFGEYVSRSRREMEVFLIPFYAEIFPALSPEHTPPRAALPRASTTVAGSCSTSGRPGSIRISTRPTRAATSWWSAAMSCGCWRICTSWRWHA